MRLARTLALSGLALGLPAAARGQAAPASPDPQPLAVGTVAPDFTIPGGTRYGVLRAPIHLADFRGKTVVLAFFYKAQTRG